MEINYKHLSFVVKVLFGAIIIFFLLNLFPVVASESVAVRLVDRLDKEGVCKPHLNLNYKFVSSDVSGKTRFLKCYLNRNEKIEQLDNALQYFISGNSVNETERLEFYCGYSLTPLELFCEINLDRNKLEDAVEKGKIFEEIKEVDPKNWTGGLVVISALK